MNVTRPAPNDIATQRLAPNDIAGLEPEFKIMLQATNRSPRRIEAYLAGVDALRAFLVERGMATAVDAVAREHVEAAYAPASVKNRHDGIRQFFAWSEEEGEVRAGGTGLSAPGLENHRRSRR